MLSKCYESTEVDRRTWLHVPSGPFYFGIYKIVKYKIEETSNAVYPTSTETNITLIIQ